MPPSQALRSHFRALAAASLALAVTLGIGGCSGLIERQPSPTPQDFGGIVGALGAEGITITNPRSGDAGCSDPNLVPAAISFGASGLGVPSPILLRVYIFGSEDAYNRELPAIDACAAQWATDPATFESVDGAPYVVAGQGPWPPGFKVAVQHALRVAAGTIGASPSP
jgi:hypothetical protein